MRNFAYSRAASAQEAVSRLHANPAARYLGGGTNLVDLMRENIEQPEALVDVTRLPSTEITRTETGGLRIGAAARNTAVANDGQVRELYPMLSQAILFGASGQIRNMATVGGNLMQRTRCYYFYDEAARCNKRQPGTGCDAIGGFNRIHAILGTSDDCIATHPSDMCVALTALGATVHVLGKGRERTIPFEEFHLLPGHTPHLETALEPGELITAVDLPPVAFAKRSVYRKVRDRASYAFALVSVAAALDIDGGRIREARIGMGGVGTKPWRAHEVERVLAGAPVSVQSFREAAEAELAAARGFAHNAFKIELARRTLVSVLSELSGLEAQS